MSAGRENIQRERTRWWEMSFGQPKREACEAGISLLLVCEEVNARQVFQQKPHTSTRAQGPTGCKLWKF